MTHRVVLCLLGTFLEPLEASGSFFYFYSSYGTSRGLGNYFSNLGYSVGYTALLVNYYVVDENVALEIRFRTGASPNFLKILQILF